MKAGHYTSASALISILEKETLWATNIKFLNDEHEFFHALDLASKVTQESKQKFNQKGGFLEAHDLYTKDITEQLESLNRYSAESIFTCSFSEQTDLLSQWRGYCPGNHGYCIEYDIHGILSAANSEFKNIKLFACVYDDKSKTEQIYSVLNRHWHKYVSNSETKSRQDVITSLSRELVMLASHFKHPAFAEEREHRLVVQLDFDSSEKTKFRTGPMSIIPYVEIPAPKKLIKNIRIGPTRDQKLATRGLTALVEAKFDIPIFLTSLSIDESKIPYRA